MFYHDVVLDISFFVKINMQFALKFLKKTVNDTIANRYQRYMFLSYRLLFNIKFNNLTLSNGQQIYFFYLTSDKFKIPNILLQSPLLHKNRLLTYNIKNSYNNFVFNSCSNDTTMVSFTYFE